MKKYFDAAASTPLHPLAQEEMKSVMDLYGNQGSKHEEGFKVQKKIEEYLKIIADVLGVPAHQLAITNGGTDGNKKVLWAMRKRFAHKDIWASAFEHASVLEEILPERKFIPGECVDPKNPSALALMAVNNETGRICDVESLSDTFSVPTLSDWVQGIGKIPFDPSHCDFATISAHKIYGPKGVGILWMGNPHQFPELSQNHHTENIVGIAGMAKAFELLRSSEHKQATENITRWTKVIEAFITKNIPDSKIHDIHLPRAGGITNVAFKGIRGGELQAALSKEESICVSTGSACTSDILTPSNTLQAIEKDPDYQFPIRISLHQFLDDEAVENFCETLKHYVEEARKQ